MASGRRLSRADGGSAERAVKVVTEAASAALGEEQHVWISGRLEHRRQLPNIEEQTVACAVPD